MAAEIQVASDLVFLLAEEPWQMALWLVAAAAAAWWGWNRYGPTAPGAAGTVGRCARSLALALLVLAAAGPSWRRTETRLLPGRALVAVDVSASMARADAAGGGTRIAQSSALAESLVAAAAQRRLAVEVVAVGGADGPLALQPRPAATGAASPLGEQLDRLVAARRPDLLVLASDGRVTDGPALAAVAARWAGRDLRVLALASGSARVDPELAIDAIEVNRDVALGELEPITVRLLGRALPPGEVEVSAHLDGAAPARLRIPAPRSEDPSSSASAEAGLELSFPHEGPMRVAVTATAGGLVARQEVQVTVRERRLQVLILAQRPRYEMRYLREAFKRDRGVTLHAYLADGRWRRWGVDGPDRLPLSPADLAGYDAVLLGDLGAEALRPVDWEAIAAAVQKRGLGLVLLPGETGAAAGWRTTAIGNLLPVDLPDAHAIALGYQQAAPRRPVRTPIAASLGLLESGGTAWADLPVLLGACPFAAIRPGADVLLADQDGAALVAASSRGAGRVLVVACDDTWRWRRGVGDRYLHRFHSQLLRYAAAGRRGGGMAWRLFATPRRAVSGEPVAIHLVPMAGAGEDPPNEAAVRLSGAAGEVLVRMVRDGPGFSARLPAPAPGSWELTAAAGVAASQCDPGELAVAAPAAEARDPRLDRPGLEAFVRTTGGQLFDDPARLLAALPADLRRSESHIALLGLWDTWWTLLAAVGLLCLDWAIRRWHRMP